MKNKRSLNIKWLANSIRGIYVGILTGLCIVLFANTISLMGELNTKNPFAFLLLVPCAIVSHMVILHSFWKQTNWTNTEHIIVHRKKKWGKEKENV